MAASTPQPQPAAENAPSQPRAARSTRPNYNLIHKDPMPLMIDALPPLIPHNPLSLLFIAWAYVRSMLSPAKQPVFKGLLSLETRSVHIRDPIAIRALWENGFFGKGTLSRSEPTWLNREKKRLGIIAADTSEEITRRRREERAEFKRERARKEREEIEATLKRESEGGDGSLGLQIGHAKGTEGVNANGLAKQPADGSIEAHAAVEPSDFTMVSGNVIGNGSQIGMNNSSNHLTRPTEPGTSQTQVGDEDIPHDVPDLEHLQLALEEAFFLHFALGVLDICVSPSSAEHDSQHRFVARNDIFQLFQAASSFSPTATVAVFDQPDITFLASYAVYHHFRSLGWVIRPGTKFAVDWMLYNRGPVFSHAEFAVITVPSYSHPAWKTERHGRLLNKQKSWHWLHMVNRVQSQVRKTLILAFVEIPPPSMIQATSFEGPAAVFSKMSVREVLLRRWIPNRNRD